MKYVFDYEETRVRRVEVEAENLAEALEQVYDEVDDIKWKQKDFYAGEIRMPVRDNFLPMFRNGGVDMPKSETEDMDIVIDFW